MKRLALASIFVATFLALIAAEIGIRGMRYFFPEHPLLTKILTYSDLKMAVGGWYAPSEFNSFSLATNYVGTQPSMEQVGKLNRTTTNSLGLRNREVPREKPTGTFRILVLGDSYTFGVYLGDNETYPAVLENILKARGVSVEVMNAGFADGFCPDEHYSWLSNTGLKFKPDLVIYGYFIGNDMDCANPNNWIEKDARGLPVKIKDPNLRVENGRLRSAVKDYKTVGADWYFRVPVLRDSYVFVVAGKAANRLFLSLLPAEEDPLPWILREESTPKMKEHERRFFTLVKGMQELSSGGKAKFLVAMIPINFQVHSEFLEKVLPKEIYGPKRVARDFFAEASVRFSEMGIEHVNLLPRLRSTGSRVYPDNWEIHFNASGAAIVGKILADQIDERRFIPGNY